MKVIGLFLALIQFTWISQAYFKGPSSLNFDNAQQYCQDQGSTLATIETEIEWNHAKTACAGSNCYIGLQDEINGDNDMIWSWSDGTDIASDYGFNSDRTATTGSGPWNSGEPNEYQGSDEDCVEMYSTGKYNDVGCSDSNYPLCNSKYFRGPSTLSYANAVAYCEDNFGAIASIETEEDWEEAVLVAGGYNVWVGLQDEINGDNDMIWSWTDGTSIASNYGFNSDRTATTGQGPWNSGEPNEYQGSDEDCVEMYNTGKYNDVSCSDSNYPLCKVIEPTGQYYVGASTLSFDAAIDYCEATGGIIASIPTEDDWEDARVTAYGKNVWIGLRDEFNGDGDMLWQWADGTDIVSNYGFNSDRTATYGQAPWNTGEPNEYQGSDEDCVEMYDTGLYNDQSCSDSNYPLCKTKFFRGSSQMSFDAAVEYCADEGGVIVSLPTETIYNAAVEAADGYNVWVGLQDEINGDGDMVWSWTDGTDASSTYGFNSDRTATTGSGPWNSGEPNEYLGWEEDCVEMYDTGLYNDISCSDNNYPLCMLYVREPTPEPTSNPTTSSPTTASPTTAEPTTAAPTESPIYFVGTSAMTFDAAVSYCEDAGGLIASIPTEEDWEEAVSTANGLNVWVGLQDDTTYDNDMVWSWTDGTDIASNFGFNADRSATTGEGPWNSGEPNEYLGWEEDCVEMYDTGKYNDISCTDSNYPLCKERYYLGTEAVKFQDAKTYCEEQGDVLAIIPTEAHWEAAKRVANGNEVWIGLRDEIRGESDMIWFWIDGSDITDSFGFRPNQTATTGQGPWYPGEPNEYLGTDEDCVEMYTNGYYNDIPCRGYDHLPLCMVVIDEPCYADVCSVEELEDYCTANSKTVAAPNNVPYNNGPYYGNNGFENQQWFTQYMDGFKQTLDANMMAIMILFTLVNVTIGVASCYINAKMCRKQYTKVVQYDITTDEEALK